MPVVSVTTYRDAGFLPEAFVNFLCLLGWNPGSDIEIMSIGDMIHAFAVEGLSRKAAIFDPKKLEWMNGQHLMRSSAGRLLPLVARGLADAGVATLEEVESRRTWFLELIDVMKVRARTIDDIVQQSRPYVRDDIEYDAGAVAKQWKDADATSGVLSAARDRLAAVPDWSAASLEGALRELADFLGVAGGKLFQPLRVALTGSAVSPGIFEVLMILGRGRSMARIDAAIRYLAEHTRA